MIDPLKRLDELTSKMSDRITVDPEMFSQIVDSLPDGLLVIDDHGTIQLVNQQIELLFGYPRSMLLGNPVHMLLAPDLSVLHAAHIAQYFSHPTVRPMNLAKALPGRHSSGRIITVQISLGPVVSSQGVLALALVRRIPDGKPSG